MLYFWLIQTQGKDSQLSKHIIPIAITEDGERAPWLKKLDEKLLNIGESQADIVSKWKDLAKKHKQKIHEILHRDLQYSAIIEEGMTYSSRILAIFAIQE